MAKAADKAAQTALRAVSASSIADLPPSGRRNASWIEKPPNTSAAIPYDHTPGLVIQPEFK
jgi:hypothetical protein